MTVPSATSRTNEKADELRHHLWDAGLEGRWVEWLDAALSEERRLTVERIRERLNTTDRPLQFQSAVWFSKIVGILDEIGGPMTPSQAAQEQPTSPRTEHGVGFVDKVGIECLCRWTCFFGGGGWVAFNDHLREAAAATPSLDSRLRDFVSAYFDTVDGDGTPAEVYTAEQDMRKAWERVVNPALAARLDEGSATPDPDA